MQTMPPRGPGRPEGARVPPEKPARVRATADRRLRVGGAERPRGQLPCTEGGNPAVRCLALAVPRGCAWNVDLGARRAQSWGVGYPTGRVRGRGRAGPGSGHPPGPHSLDSRWGGGRKRRPTLVASVGSLLGAGVITRPRSAVFDADTFSASSPLCPHLGAQVRKSGPSLLWHQWGVPPGAHLAAEHTPVLGRRLPRPRPQIPHPHPRGLGLRGLTALTMLRLLAPVTWGWQTVRSVTDAVWLAAVCRPGHASA